MPYTERHNRIQYSDFTADSGLSIDLSGPGGAQELLQANGVAIPSTVALHGTTIFPDSSHRHIPVDRNNWGPRLGFAYQLEKNTVLRGGIGTFYGMSNQTNYQYSGPVFRETAIMHFTFDNGITQSATLANPFPSLPANTVPQAQGTKYGKLAQWGFDNPNTLSTSGDRNPEIYQWNLGVQHLLPLVVVVSVDYSANRSTHLPWGYVGPHPNALPENIRKQLVNALNPAQDTTQSPVSDLLATQVTNPFRSMFQGSGAIFNEPESQYNNDTIPLSNLLVPFPQFDGGFGGAPLLEASSWYNGMLVRFKKRPSHGLSFEGNYVPGIL
jgi:hypothetical protein